ncbi:hypothetical protein HF264_17065 [Rhizobium leguminosarum]|jgi:hypothetical protein|uniref:hypothetical protein n=2 Tax=Rhizobium TaxID=379 RepID=UPI001C903D00|nr:hypothetical protein [Rhizobium leguminosarum]MBY2941405.1 hypothetical protein [Rhizobium leguminosarum]
MTEQAKRKLSMSEIATSLRDNHRLSPELQQLVEQNRRQHEGERNAFRSVAQGIIGDFQKRIAAALKLDPQSFVQVPHDVIDGWFQTGGTATALAAVPGTKINIDFTSSVTVNGIPVPDAK